MALRIWTGIPGSGKTAGVMYELYKEIVKKDNPRFRIVYTNIAGIKKDDERLKGLVNWLNFDILLAFCEFENHLYLANQAVINYDDEVEKLFNLLENSTDFNEFKEDFELLELNIKLPELIGTKKEGKGFEKYFELIKGFKFWGAWFIIDEFHNYFNSQNKNLIRWLTYHRHFHQDLDFITQNLGLIASCYKKIAQEYYQAIPPQKRLSRKLLGYKKSSSPNFPNDATTSNVDLKPPKEVFELYTSGKAEFKIPKLWYWIGVLIFLLLIVGYFFYIAFSRFGSSTSAPTEKKIENSKKIEKVDVNKSVKLPVNKIKDNSNFIDNNKKLVCFACNNNSCSFDGKIYTSSMFNYFSKKFKFEFAFKEKVLNTTFYHVWVTNEFFDKYLKKPIKKDDENLSKKNDFTLPNFNLSH